jgi:serine protease Do
MCSPWRIKDRFIHTGDENVLRSIFGQQTTLRAGVAAMALVIGGGALLPQLSAALAAPVSVDAVQTTGFADVVEKVQPAVVSVRVKARIDNVTLNGKNGGPGLNVPGFDNLPEDHPMRRFFREFGEGNGNNRGSQNEGQRGEEQNGERRIRPVSQGSGFFISEDGYIVTNNHVVEGGAEFTVVMEDGKEVEAKLVGTDPKTDLAVLKIEPTQKLTYVEFADETGVRVGDWVVAIGNPFGLGGTVTAGIVSGLGRDIGAGPYSDFIQIDAAVNRGNSGGPAFNLKGQVVGVNTAIFSPSGGNVGIAFAIPASTAKEVVADLRANGNVTRGFIGVRIQPLTEDLADSLGLENAEGALVANVLPDGPAAKAGFEAGDVIVAVDGKKTDSPRQLTRQIGAIAPGETASLDVMRDGKPVTLSLKLAKLENEVAAAAPATAVPQESKPASIEGFGIEVMPNDKGDGVVIVTVDPQSAAADQGLRAGDIILEVNGVDIKAITDVDTALAAAKSEDRKNVLMRITRDDNARFLALPVDKG